ncbi:hypothetical protein AM10699_08030 [Acaryochloris marina MBIC10699]|nr:hypothetical protein AM10699_08030 [Acaryochloris marina MBIC10699]
MRRIKVGSWWGEVDTAAFYQRALRQDDLILTIANPNSLMKINKGEGILNMEVIALSTLKTSLRDLLFNE